MRKFCLYFLIVASCLLHPTFLPAQVVVTSSVVGQVNATFTGLFNALRNGHVDRIRGYLSAEEYAKFKVLFEQNTDYPDFLRNYYRGAIYRLVRVDSVASVTDDVIGEFIIDFPGGETLNTRLRLNRDRAGNWKIKKTLRDKTDQGESDGENRH